jgi:hypothetical protein
MGVVCASLGCGNGTNGNDNDSSDTTQATGSSSEGSATETVGDGDGDGDSTGETTTGTKFDTGKMDVGGDDTGPGVDESTCEKAAESLTSAGCLFAPLMLPGNTSLPWAVVAANTNVNDATAMLYAWDGAMIEQAVIPPGELYTFVLDGGGAMINQHAIPESTGIQLKAMKLESDIPIVAYQFSPYSSSQNATSDASLLLPYHAWGTDYLAADYFNNDDSNAWVSIVSFDDQNDVTVTMPDYMVGSSQPGNGIPGLSAGQSTNQALDDGEVLRVLVPGSGILGDTGVQGARIESTEPVALFVGTPSSSIPGPGFNQFKDHLEEQLPPRTAWGKEYAAIHFRPRSTEADHYRFMADKDGTMIFLDGDYQDQFQLDAGEWHEVSTTESFYASGTEAFLVTHYMVSTGLTPGAKDDNAYPGNFLSPNCSTPSQTRTELGDPAISYFPAVAQYRFNYTFLTPNTYAWDMMTVIGPVASWGTIVFDGQPLPEDPTPLGVQGLGYAHFLIEDGPHEIHSDQIKFGLEVYGYDCRVSYAYPGGLSLAEINDPPD